MKYLLMAAMLLASSVGAYAQFSCGGTFFSTGICNGGIASVATPCNQTGLDFTVNCNMILIPALIH